MKRVCYFFVGGVLVIAASGTLFPMQRSAGGTPAPDQENIRNGPVERRIEYVFRAVDNSVHRANEAMALAYNSNTRSIDAFERAGRALALCEQVETRAQGLVEAVNQFHEERDRVYEYDQRAVANVDAAMNRLRRELDREQERIERVRDETTRQLSEQHAAASAEAEIAKIHEKQRLGVFDQKEKARIQASVDAEKTRWSEVKNMVSDPFFVAKVVLGVAAIAVGFYGTRYALRYLYEHFTLPRVISQTSRSGWFGNKVDMQSETIDDLVFEPRVHKQLFELSLRVKTAKEFGENLPNVLFYGPSGTGKTAFAKALAYWSGLDYAITSGSEFAKITDLNLASGELRKLLDWSKNSDKGLIIFIDEAESLFADRNLTTTPKIVHDFINTFLSLISDQSQKGLMFIFATNHPFKIDEAILNRIGTMVEFLLPQKPEQVKIFCEHLERYSHEPEKVPVDFDEQTMSALLDCGAKSLEGLSPREIKFLAQEIVIYARQQAANALSKETIQGVIDTVHQRQLQTKNWKNQRDEWLRKASAAAAA